MTAASVPSEAHLYVADLDGTLLRSDATLSPFTFAEGAGSRAARRRRLSGAHRRHRAASRAGAPRRSSAWAWVALAAGVALVIAAASRRREIALWFGHEPVGPDTEQTPDSVLAERAVRLRHDAVGLCEQGFWDLCEKKLNEARQLDPAGESGRQVQAARRSIDEAGRPPEAGKPKQPDKPGR